MNYQKETIKEIANCILNEGFRVFIAERETYGFFTDKEGSKVISFGLDCGVLSFSGNYKTSSPRETGTGWQITNQYPAFYKDVFKAAPPQWAVRTHSWKYTTLDQYLDTYQKSSRFTEIELSEE